MSFPFYDFFDLAFHFYPSQDEIRKKFKRNVVANHPDLNSGENDSEIKTAQNNEAYKTLKDDKKRISYILHQTEMLKEGENEKLSPMFLMEMMELNESLEMATAEEKEAALKELELKNNTFWQEIESIGKEADLGNLDIQEALDKIKGLYLQGKYLDRIMKLNKG